MKRFFIGLTLLLSFYVPLALAQTSDGGKQAAFKDLSGLVGIEITNNEQAKEACNLEKYLVGCAEIGKKYNLFNASEKKQVEVILAEFKGKVLDDLKSCTNEECLLGVANRIAVSLNKKDSSLAKSLDLTSKKIEEKKDIILAAKEIGVSLNDCQSLDPDTASLELLRACAKLSKHESVKQQIMSDGRVSQSNDGSFALSEALRKGEYNCGNNTAESCGNFCLKPIAGTTEAPLVCREIAQKFFGPEGVKQLESAYQQVQVVFKQGINKVENLGLVTASGERLSDPKAIGNYIEAQAKNGNIEAVDKGMDFMIAHGFVSKDDKAFALDFVKKVRDSKGGLDLDACSLNPENCRQYISKQQNADLDVRQEINKVFKEEANKLGLSNYANCTQGGVFTEECLVAAKASLPVISSFVNEHPEANILVQQMKERIQSAEQSLLARKQAEAKLSSGENIIIGDVIFKKFEDVQTYCAKNGQECLTESARKGYIPREFAAQKYEQFFDLQKNYVQPQVYINQPQVSPYNFQPDVPVRTNPNIGFNKEEALKNFQSWLDNPQGPPPIPGYLNPIVPPLPIINNPAPQIICPNIFPAPCQQGFYRSEFRDVNGCKNYNNECLAIPGYIAPVLQPVEQINKLPVPEIIPVVPGVVSQPVPSVIQCDWNTQYLKASRSICLPRTGCSYPGDSEYNSVECNVIRTSAVWSNSTAPAGQKQIVWNSLGLKSWVLVSANEERVSKLKVDCASVPANANIWMNGAGDYTSIDFGMPDPAKCKTVTPLPMPVDTLPVVPSVINTLPAITISPTISGICNSELISLLGVGCHNMGNAFFDANMTKWVVPPATVASSCSVSYLQNCSIGTSGSQGQSCPALQYWNGTACVATSGGVSPGVSSCPANIEVLLGYGCHAMSEAYFNSNMTRYVKFGATAVLECGATSIAGCSSNSSAYTSCPNSQYWNGTACIVNPVGTTGAVSSCSADITALLGEGCHAMSEAYFNGPMSRYVRFNSTTVVECSVTSISGCPGSSYVAPASACASGQYWNGSSCVTSSTNTACPSGQYWSGNACVASPNYNNTCPAYQYWNGTACVTSSTNTACPAGQYWSGSACVISPTAPTSYLGFSQLSVLANCPAKHTWNGQFCVYGESASNETLFLASLWQSIFNWLR